MLAVVAGFVSETSAAVITIPDVIVTADQETVDVPVFIIGGLDDAGAPERIQNVSIGLQVGDGGPLLGGAETVSIAAVDYRTGTIFGELPLSTSSAFPLPSRGANILNVSVNREDFDVELATDGTRELLFTATLDLSTASPGETLDFNLNAGGATQINNSDGGLLSDLAFDVGTLQVTAIPEPSSLMLLVGGGVGCFFNYRRRLKHQH